MKVFVAIPTFNRLALLESLARTLAGVVRRERHHVHVLDDASPDVGPEDLARLFPGAVVERNARNLGADLNSYALFGRFLESDCDALFICDADLIVHPDCLTVIEEHLVHTDGAMSLFNASAHPALAEVDDVFVQKRRIGAAGAVFSRALAAELVAHIPRDQATMFDWSISAYVHASGRRLLVTRRSYVQHLGLYGENATFLNFDWGLGYVCASEFERACIASVQADFFERFVASDERHLVAVLQRKLLRKGLQTGVANVIGERGLIEVLRLRKRLARRTRGGT